MEQTGQQLRDPWADRPPAVLVPKAAHLPTLRNTPDAEGEQNANTTSGAIPFGTLREHTGATSKAIKHDPNFIPWTSPTLVVDFHYQTRACRPAQRRRPSPHCRKRKQMRQDIVMRRPRENTETNHTTHTHRSTQGNRAPSTTFSSGAPAKAGRHHSSATTAAWASIRARAAGASTRARGDGATGATDPDDTLRATTPASPSDARSRQGLSNGATPYAANFGPADGRRTTGRTGSDGGT